jgi:hypothetical protein
VGPLTRGGIGFQWLVTIHKEESHHDRFIPVVGKLDQRVSNQIAIHIPSQFNMAQAQQ